MSDAVNQQSSSAKVRGVADIMFCIDNSGSMRGCIEGVMNHVRDFISGLEASNANASIDWRMGITLYNSNDINFQDLTKDISKVKSLLSIGAKGSDEFTPGAVDFAITNTSWRAVSHKVLILFTDETIRGGSTNCESDKGVGKFDDLLQKMSEAKIQLLYYGPYCDSYDEFNSVPKAIVNKVDNFNTVNFSDLLKNIAATVSQSAAMANQGEQSRAKISGMIYNISPIHIIKH